MTQFSIDAYRLNAEIENLALLSEAEPPAVTRVLFSDADLQAREYIRKLCLELGLRLREDPVGNMFASWTGTQADAAAIATGSHIDAIPNAGRFDGVVGVLGALAAIRALQAAGFQPRRSIELIVFTAEEPTRFGIGCLGSRLMAGALEPSRAEAFKDPDGQSLEHWRRKTGIGGRLADVRLAPGTFAGFIELHIEQGPLLEKENVPIGIVEKIAAPATLRIRLTGTGGHAGAVLMPERHDALLAGAEISLAVEKAALTSGSPDAVATTGVFRIEPGAVNSVPCAARLEIDVRDTRLEARDRALQNIEVAARDICKRRGVELHFECLNADAPAQCDGALVASIEAICQELGLKSKRMISRAYHDSLFMARICPTTMIFIPCRDGVSHRPDEFSSPRQIEQGATVLAHALARASMA